jgi:epsilon-lactone hydrolase
LAERLEAAGVSVELEIWDKMIHVWQLFAPILSEGREAIDKAGAFIAAKVE